MVTNDNNSLLAHLAYKFSGQTETTATEALGYILSRSEAARNALRDTLKTGGADVGPIARVQTEVDINVKAKEGAKEKDARIDLVGFGEGDAKRALIEVKFWAGLTENQPNTYLEELLKNEEPSALLFVAPESRLETLWTEILRLAANDKAKRFTLDAGNIDGETNLPSAVVNGGPHRLMLTSWRAMLGAMASRASVDGDSAAERDILQLNALCERQDTEAFLPLRSSELGPQFARRMPQFIQLAEDAREHVKVKPFVSVTYPTNSATNSHGRYLTLLENVPVWFGVRYDLWAKRGDTPLWLVVRRTPFAWAADFNEVKRCLEPLIKQPSILDDPAEGILIPFFLPTGVEREEALESVAVRLEEVCDLIGWGCPTAKPPNS